MILCILEGMILLQSCIWFLLKTRGNTSTSYYDEYSKFSLQKLSVLGMCFMKMWRNETQHFGKWCGYKRIKKHLGKYDHKNELANRKSQCCCQRTRLRFENESGIKWLAASTLVTHDMELLMNHPSNISVCYLSYHFPNIPIWNLNNAGQLLCVNCYINRNI